MTLVLLRKSGRFPAVQNRSARNQPHHQITDILHAYDLARSFRDAGERAGSGHYTLKHYIEKQEAAGGLTRWRPGRS